MLRDTPVLISLHPALDEKVDLNDTKWEDIHVTTGALKMFFRELPEPLFTYGSFTDFVDAISESPLSFLILATRWRHAPVHAAYVLLSAAAALSRFRMLRPQAAGESHPRLNQEVAKTQPRHNASPLQTPAQVKKVARRHCRRESKEMFALGPITKSVKLIFTREIVSIKNKKIKMKLNRVRKEKKTDIYNL